VPVHIVGRRTDRDRKKIEGEAHWSSDTCHAHILAENLAFVISYSTKN